MDTQDQVDICKCGRDAVRHCPECGSTNYYGLKNMDVVTVTDKETGAVTREKVRVFRCRRCANVFNDMTWRTMCQAPPPVTRNSAVARKRAEAINNAISNLEKDRMGTLRELFAGQTLKKDKTI